MLTKLETRKRVAQLLEQLTQCTNPKRRQLMHRELLSLGHKGRMNPEQRCSSVWG